jgi:hypothetical protein
MKNYSQVGCKMSEDNTQEVQTPENTVEDTSAEVSPEVETPQEDLSRKSLDRYKDDYDRQVDQLLQRYNAEQDGTPVPEPETLREGESWDKVYDQVPESAQRAMASLRRDYTQKTQEYCRRTAKAFCIANELGRQRSIQGNPRSGHSRDRRF